MSERLTLAEATEWAKRFHEAYERLAPQHGYQTRWDVSPIAWEAVPESNRNLVTAVCAELVPQILARVEAAPEREALERIKMIVAYIVTQTTVAGLTKGVTDGPRATSPTVSEVWELVNEIGNVARAALARPAKEEP